MPRKKNTALKKEKAVSTLLSFASPTPSSPDLAHRCCQYRSCDFFFFFSLWFCQSTCEPAGAHVNPTGAWLGGVDILRSLQWKPGATAHSVFPRPWWKFMLCFSQSWLYQSSLLQATDSSPLCPQQKSVTIGRYGWEREGQAVKWCLYSLSSQRAADPLWRLII